MNSVSQYPLAEVLPGTPLFGHVSERDEKNKLLVNIWFLNLSDKPIHIVPLNKEEFPSK